jgi:hypothetical protein
VAVGESVSEQPTAAPARPPGSKAPGKKYAGLTRTQWLITGGVFVAALAFIWWRRRQAASAAAAQTPTSAGSNECTDANGNPVDCGELTAQELAAIQNQLDQLASQAGGGGSGGAGSGGGGTTDGSTGTTTATAAAPGTPTSSSGSTAPAVKTAPRTTAAAITGLAASAVTKTSFKASWNAAAGATGGYAYIVRDLATHKQVTSGTTRAASVTVSGLKSGTDYNFGVQALPGGAGANIHVRTK